MALVMPAALCFVPGTDDTSLLPRLHKMAFQASSLFLESLGFGFGIDNLRLVALLDFHRKGQNLLSVLLRVVFGAALRHRRLRLLLMILRGRRLGARPELKGGRLVGIVVGRLAGSAFRGGRARSEWGRRESC
jgi:hypothetical protein